MIFFLKEIYQLSRTSQWKYNSHPEDEVKNHQQVTWKPTINRVELAHFTQRMDQSYSHKKVWLWNEGNAGNSYKWLPLVLIMSLFSFLLPHEWPAAKLGFVHVSISDRRGRPAAHIPDHRGERGGPLFPEAKQKGGGLGNKSRETLRHDDGWCLPKRLNLKVKYIHLRVLWF